MKFSIPRINSHEKDDQKISIALMAPFVILTIQYFILINFNLIGSSQAASVQSLSKGLVGLAFLYSLPAVLRCSKIKLIGLYFIAMFAFIINYAIFENNRPYLDVLIFPLFFMSLPSFVYALSIENFEIFKEYMKKASYIVFLFGSLLGILIFAGRASAGAYSMSLSYYMLLPIIVFINDLFERFSLIKAILSLISLLVIVAFGSRGAILCVIVFMILKFLRPNTIRTYKRSLGYLSVIGAGIIFLIFLNQILERLYLILLNFGINSRTLVLFLREEIHLSGRDKLYNQVINKFMDNPLAGIGLMGDRLVLNGTYSHNFFIEIISNFGIIFGAFLSIGLVILIINRLLIADHFKYSLSSMWISLGFVHLLISGSYLIDIKFWILMGLLLNSNMKK